MFWTDIIVPQIEFRKSDQVFDHTGRLAVSEVNLILDKIQYRPVEISTRKIDKPCNNHNPIDNSRFQTLFRKSVKFFNFWL